ncbi:aminotransferase-like domain-containing protein [Agrobacterium tumefaciens]|uniref:aminotransferase-like domain-containing protein n=1 Tax=Agrobacterium tumefaciens TaxID=358 RepID=UPI001CBF0B6A|nr:PLP-dependent aminotransferase family protein [Agrobacterium tumefaciens]
MNRIGEEGNSAMIESRVAYVMRVIRKRIAEKAIPSGAKLPSIRELSRSLRVSKSTVVNAYDRLISDGIILSRRGSGFFVAGHQPLLSIQAPGQQIERDIDPLWVSRQSLDSRTDFLRPGCGWLPADWMPEESLCRALRGISRDRSAAITQYGSSLGHSPLRDRVSRQLRDHGVKASPCQIILVESGANALDLVCRFLIAPGETVLVDDPCYFNFSALLRVHRVNIVSVKYTTDGPDIEEFEKVVSETRPKLYLTNAGIHNPTGTSLSSAAAFNILRIAEKYNMFIVEDDAFSEFEQHATPRLASFDELKRVIQIGSFSKTLSASLRCGYIAARAEWIDALADIKIATSFGSANFSAHIIEAVLADGTYRKHVNSLHQRLASAMGSTIVRLRALKIEPWFVPLGGMFLWCKLPNGADSAIVAQYALKEGIILAPGNAFSHSQAWKSYVRFNVAQSSDPRIYTTLSALLSRDNLSGQEVAA